MKRQVIDTLKRFLLALPFFTAICRRLSGRHLRALMFHRFSADPDPAGHRVARAMFRDQLAEICRHYRVIDPTTFMTPQQESVPDDRRPGVLLTVDDGYDDFYDHALPELRAANVPAILFATTGFINGDLWLWWDQLRYVLTEAATGHYEFVLDGQRRELELGAPGDADRAWDWISNRLRFLPQPTKLAVVASLSAAVRVPIPARPPARYRSMSWDQVREAAAQGVTIGAHTVSHAILSLLDAADMEREIAGSKRKLDAELGQSTFCFCYPQGFPEDYNAATIEQVERCGFRYAFTAHLDPNWSGGVFVVPRYSVSNDLLTFRWQLCGAEYLVASARRAVVAFFGGS